MKMKRDGDRERLYRIEETMQIWVTFLYPSSACMKLKMVRITLTKSIQVITNLSKVTSSEQPNSVTTLWSVGAELKDPHLKK